MKNTAADRAGRTDDEWDELATAAAEILLEQGRRPDPRITYSDLNQSLGERTGLTPFRLDTEQGRWAIGALLAEVNERTLPEIEGLLGRKALLSALVWLKGGGDLGGGFYDYAWQKGMLKSRTSDAKLVFVSQQIHLITNYCNRMG
ncbi:hypothetical protein [Mycobacterium sp. OAE908]|uniref:hypothetical protein n=1 Tax=Mycobacterium sp. OAE908 TaxID=2817899 RepID=UPI001AEB2A05